MNRIRTAVRYGLVLLLSLGLSACATLYTTTRDWKLPGGLARYTITAQLNVGFFSRSAIISINGRPLLTGTSYFWSNTIEMSGSYDGVPIAAICDDSAKTCDVSIANFHAATLKF